MSVKTFRTTSAAQTRTFGARLARELKGGETIALIGHLGSGKTTFIKGLARGLGVKQTITSPTFVLMKVYPVKPVRRVKRGRLHQFVHVDCYRVPGVELAAIGLGDYLNQTDTVVAIEWAEKLPKKFKPTLKLEFRVGIKSMERIIRIKSIG